MLYVVPNLGRRVEVLTRAARAYGLRALRDDPLEFSALLEKTILAHDRWFTPKASPDTLSNEEMRLHIGRLEDLVDEAVSLALELYTRRRRDVALLMIAQHAERLARRIWSDPWSSGAKLINELARHHPPSSQERSRTLQLLKDSPDGRDPSTAR